MHLTIETYKRNEGHLAVVCEDGALLSSGGCGGGETERDAIHQAVNAWFTHRANAAANAPIMPQGEFTFSIDIPRATYANLTGHPLSIGGENIPPAVSSDSGGKREMPASGVHQQLVWAKDEGEEVEIDYVDGRENVSTRVIRVLSFEDKSNSDAPMGAVIHVKTIDCDISEPRTFRLDRIQAVRAVA